MVVDTSVVIAILRKEDGYVDLLKRLLSVDEVWISAVNLLEAYVVMGHRHADVSRLIDDAAIRVQAFAAADAERARDAYLRFGKGHHKASLNICDCAAYAAAQSRQCPLLFKGHDFTATDVIASG